MNVRISTKGKRPLRSLTPSDKVHAIQRIHDGESKASVARDIGVPESTLRGWCKNEDKLRFMSRQAAAEKYGNESLTVKHDGTTSMLGGPAEKRQRLDPSLALNFSNKIKYDDLNSFKRAQMNGLDFSNNKALTDLGNFSGMSQDYASFNGSSKKPLYNTDISRVTDPTISAVSPLSSLTHLSGLTGLNQSPLAISFNELTTNLTLLAQLNPNLAAISGINNINGMNANFKAKPASQQPSPRDPSEKHSGISVKNWAKQNQSTPTSNESNTCGLNLCQNEEKIQMKSQNSSIPTPAQLGSAMPLLSSISEDPLLYWLKSQQAILGFNNMYPHNPVLGAPSSPIRTSTPQQGNFNSGTPPIIPNTLTPSSTPSGSLDDKNAAWFNWCKAFGVSLNSLTPAAVVSALQGNTNSNNIHSPNNMENCDQQITTKTGYENILYSQLTKDSISNCSANSETALEQEHVERLENSALCNKPEDLSAKTFKTSPPSTPVPTPEPLPLHEHDQLSDKIRSDARQDIDNVNSSGPMALGVTQNKVVDCKDVIDNILYKISTKSKPESRLSEEGDQANSNDDDDDDDSIHNNNNNSNKTDEEHWNKCNDFDCRDETDTNSKEAIKYGEKFLQWLENCSNPRVTAVQLMQLRLLISSIKDTDDTSLKQNNEINKDSSIEIDGSSEEGVSFKPRRRK
ncbi:protein distal antenna [Musca domestica]|uniref:Protein distal antenna n=1 Tax=Musca domestica TaxID=7370 RepID=A0A1I8MBM3_MUSDO|nr:protein distal antenna [Musca domestica]